MTREKRELKSALVISGGGSKGAFAVGVVKNLYERFRPTGWFSIVGGCSTGALITPLVGLMGAPGPLADKALEVLLHEYENVVTSDVLERRPIAQLIRYRDSLYSFAPLRARVTRVLTEESFGWLQRPEAPYCYVEYTNFRSGRRVVASPKDPAMSRERFIDCLIASASVPVITEATLIDGEPCYDGGVRDVIPIERAVELEAEIIVPVFLDPANLEEFSWRRRRLDRLLYRSILILLDETQRNDLEGARVINAAVRAKREVLAAARWNPLLYRRLAAIFEKPEYRGLFGRERRLIQIFDDIRPERSLTDEPLRFDPSRMRRWVQLGERQALLTVRETPFRRERAVFAAPRPETAGVS